MGAVFRTIPTKILTLEQLNMPPIMHELADKEKGLILVTGYNVSLVQEETVCKLISYLTETPEEKDADNDLRKYK